MEEDWNIILSILDSPEKSLVGTQKVFTASPISIGRAENSDLIINDPTASRNHAIIRITNDYTRVFITDMSTYGTEVSGKPVPKGRGSGFTITNGDIIKIGSTAIRFELNLKTSVQSTFIGNIDRSFLDKPPEKPKPPIVEPEMELVTPVQEEVPVVEEKKGLRNIIWLVVILACIALLVYMIFFM